MVALVCKPTSVGASEKQKNYEDDLHFTPVSLHEKDTNSSTKKPQHFIHVEYRSNI
jgi:hypothetical protein